MWKYKGKQVKSIDDIPEGAIGFVYKIVRVSDGKAYWGKKVLEHSKKTRISKREKVLTPTRKVFKRTVKDSGWINYWGSSQELKADIVKLGKEAFTREILEYAYSKKYLSYCELMYQVKNDVLSRDTYNKNILCKFYCKDVINQKEL